MIDWVKEPSSSGSRGSDSSSESSSRPIRIASGKHMSIDDRRYRVYRPHNSALSVLIIRRARRQDAGIYRCNLSGSSTRHKYMVLNVTESKIEAQTSSAKTVAKVGSDVSLWCNATGYPKPVVYWTREDRNRRLPDGNQQFWGNELLFDRVTEADTGIYTCYLDNFVQPVVSYKFSLMVEDNPWNIEGSKMRFDSSQWYRRDSAEPRPIRGKSYLLLCETRGSPKPLPTIQWYRDGSPLHSSRHFYIIEDTPEWRSSYTSSTLVIMRFQSDFQGNYTCVASNAFRMKKQTFYLSESPTAIPEVTSESRRRGRGGGRRSGKRRGGRQRKNEVPGSDETPDSKKTNLRQALDQQQQERHHAALAETTTTSRYGSDDDYDGQLPRLPVPGGNHPSTTLAPPSEDDENDDTASEDWDASGNE